jgi:hypothetical protein
MTPKSAGLRQPWRERLANQEMQRTTADFQVVGQLAMDPLLEGWLAELGSSPVVLGAAPGSGGAENLRMIDVPEGSDIDADQLLGFLREAQRVRLSQAVRAGVTPVVFYVWHDEMAGQLRFSLARGTADSLPFGARVELVPDLRNIVESYLNSDTRRGVPWEQLEDASDDDDLTTQEAAVQVWVFGLA